MNKRPSVLAPGETTVLSDKVVPSRGSAKHHLLQQALPDHTTIPLATGFIYLSLRTRAASPSGWPCVTWLCPPETSGQMGLSKRQPLSPSASMPPILHHHQGGIRFLQSCQPLAWLPASGTQCAVVSSSRAGEPYLRKLDIGKSQVTTPRQGSLACCPQRPPSVSESPRTTAALPRGMSNSKGKPACQFGPQCPEVTAETSLSTWSDFGQD